MGDEDNALDAFCLEHRRGQSGVVGGVHRLVLLPAHGDAKFRLGDTGHDFRLTSACSRQLAAGDKDGQPGLPRDVHPVAQAGKAALAGRVAAIFLGINIDPAAEDDHRTGTLRIAEYRAGLRFKRRDQGPGNDGQALHEQQGTAEQG